MADLKYALWDNFIPLAQQSAGTYSTGPVSSPGNANNVVALIFVSAVSGATHTLDVAIQTSPDNSTWTTVASATQMTAAGQQLVTAYIGSDEYGQIVATVAGTSTPTVTFNLAALVL
jgi:hypothetical protein